MIHGSSTTITAPRSAPPRLPSPPTTTATTSSSEYASVYAPGFTDCVVKHRRAPPAPAASELTANACTFTRRVGTPASRAAVSSPCTARIRRPSRPRRSRASQVVMTAVTRIATQACHCSTTMSSSRNSGTPSYGICTPWSPRNTEENTLVNAGRAITSASVTPARYGPRRRAPARPSSSPSAPDAAIAPTKPSRNRGSPSMPASVAAFAVSA